MSQNFVQAYGIVTPPKGPWVERKYRKIRKFIANKIVHRVRFWITFLSKSLPKYSR